MRSETPEIEDWIDEYFNIQRELGNNIKIQIGHKETSEPNEEIKWAEFSHARFDGVGAFAHQLRKCGWPIQSLPRSKEHKPPSRLSLLIPTILYGIAGLRKREPVNWKVYNQNPKMKSFEVSTGFLDEEKTQKILQSAKNKKTSVNTYLLKTLDDTIRENLENDQKENLWVIPVNLRGAIKRQSDESNHVSFLPVSIRTGETFHRLQQSIQEKLKLQLHWVAWKYINDKGKSKGRHAIKKMVQNNLNKRTGLIGIFSNLGAWPDEKNADVLNEFTRKKKNNGSWYVARAATASYPVIVCVLTWFGQLSITLQIHPTISNDTEMGKIILKKWIERIS